MDFQTQKLLLKNDSASNDFLVIYISFPLLETVFNRDIMVWTAISNGARHTASFEKRLAIRYFYRTSS